ncbi:hypothetical protein [Caulobacter segnis]|uniref:Uncharacterized protein n=1 Tax=Caulobacter segnis TaxID=88688 RepID=A0A2W5WCG8_9CAUL|nr:hypothetical protein [Caulobacter segnis]PZR31268.1 MAG: hypothetical protein DI526_20190 [Caulobacter segnis]
MTGPIDPIRRLGFSRRAHSASRDAGRHPDEDDVGPSAPDEDGRPASPPPRGEGFAAFAAHLMGQVGQKKGLRGGQEVLNAARSTYLGTEYSGPADRRPKAGLLKKTNI